MADPHSKIFGLTPPPPGQNVSIFMQFFYGKIDRIIGVRLSLSLGGWCPPVWGWRPLHSGPTTEFVQVVVMS